MGRNPFWPMLERTPEPTHQFGQLEVRGKRPELEALVGECLMAWPQVDAKLGLFFGQLAMPSAPMIAVFQALRRSSNQREAIATAADITLKDSAEDRYLVYSLLDVHKSIEAERNAIAHGRFGICNSDPDILVWMNTETYIDYYMMFLTGAWLKVTREKEGNEFARRLYYYRKSDLERLLKIIFLLCGKMQLTGFVQMIYALAHFHARQNTANYAVNLVSRKRCGYAVKKIAEQFSLNRRGQLRAAEAEFFRPVTRIRFYTLCRICNLDNRQRILWKSLAKTGRDLEMFG